jgi:tetratricopeptide (TPR) repeat protein
MTGRPLLHALTFVAVALLARPSAGAPPTAGEAQAGGSQEELARSHFVAGEAEYARGRWREALREFEIGYALSPRPEFLINFAQVRRKLGEYDAAERECRRYLATAPPPELAAQAQRLLQQIEDERARAPVPPPPSPTPTPTPMTNATPAPMTNATPPPTTNATQLATQLSAAPPPPKRRSRAWIAPVVVAGVLVVGGAITLGLVFGLPAHDTFKAAPLGTVDFR